MNIYIYSFEKFQTIKTFGGDIYNGSITLKEANDCQTDLLIKIMNFRKKTPKKLRKKNKKKKLFLKICIIFFRGEKKFLRHLKVKYFK